MVKLLGCNHRLKLGALHMNHSRCCSLRLRPELSKIHSLKCSSLALALGSTQGFPGSKLALGSTWVLPGNK
jgi:hypothetical protein